MIKSGKSAMIIGNKDTITKKYPNREDYNREVRGLDLMTKAHVNNLVNVININDEDMEIVYKRYFPLMDIVQDNNVKLLRSILVLGAIILDDIHSKGVVHGDFWIGNLMINETGKLIMIDFEETHLLKDELDAYADIYNFLDSLRRAFPSNVDQINTLIERISIVEVTKTMFLGKQRTRITYKPKPGLIGALTGELAAPPYPLAQ